MQVLVLVAGNNRTGAQFGDQVKSPQPLLQATVAASRMYWCTPL